MTGVEAASQAGQAVAGALVAAAQNASKPGSATSEYRASIVTIALAALLAGLKTFAVIPGPWSLPASIALAGMAAVSAAYSISRGGVKRAALTSAAAALTEGRRA